MKTLLLKVILIEVLRANIQKSGLKCFWMSGLHTVYLSTKAMVNPVVYPMLNSTVHSNNNHILVQILNNTHIRVTFHHKNVDTPKKTYHKLSSPPAPLNEWSHI